MRKICVVTGTRAEFGLLTHLMKLIDNDSDFELQLIATGMHLSPEFGYTYSEIEEAGFKVNKKIEILLSSDSSVGVSKSMGLAQISFAEAYDELEPDILLAIGDRFEMLSAVTTAMVARIPIAHFSGGEITQGAIDDSIRHCITKMSHLHFVTMDIYRQRVIQMGERPETVFNVGEIGLDNIRSKKILTREAFENSIKFKLKRKNVLITFHPVTLEEGKSESQFKELLSALDELKDTTIIFTHANSDMEGRRINSLIEEFVSMNKEKAVAFVSLGYERYLSALKHVDAVVGNEASNSIKLNKYFILLPFVLC
jgi:GDP/UDP-N,N'-diacetylbacillosamine 2-epimerase (hydrolysing)